MELNSALEALRGGAVRFPADDVLLKVRGQDARSWLQGQVTQDIRRLGHEGLRFCLCEPTGQILADAAVWPASDGLWITAHRDGAEAILNRVARLVIMEDVSAEPVDLALTSIQGPRSGDVDWGPSLAFPIDRSGYGGFDIWREPRADASPPFSKLLLLDSATAEVARIEAGVPRFGIDMGPRTLPPEMGPAFEASRVSYQKGCYTGQEVLARIQGRGHTNRTWVGLRLEAPVKAEDRVMFQGKDVGWVTSACESPRFGSIAAAMLRNEATSEGSVVTVESSGATVTSRVVALPFQGLT